MTAIEWLIEQIDNKDMGEIPMWIYDFCYKALEMEEEQNINQITDFQLFMYENNFISNHLWDFEQMSIKFLNSKKQDL